LRLVHIASALLLSGCSTVTHTYSVETKDAESEVVSATVSVCRQAPWALTKAGTRFFGANRKRCEGADFIRLMHRDGTTTDCPVGYVTTMDASFSYAVRERACGPLMEGFPGSLGDRDHLSPSA
jgi:uncharacterized protein YceK